MAVDRTAILAGPAKVGYDSATIFSLDDIVVQWITEYFEVKTSAFGTVKKRVQTRRIEVRFTPATWTDLTKILPYATKNIGDRIFGASDKPMVITPRNGAPLTLANAAITQLPGITLSADKPILRPVVFTALCAASSDAATAANFFAYGSAASDVALTGFTATFPNSLYSAAYRTNTYRSLAGFSLDFNLGLTPVVVDGDGVVDYRVASLDASLKFTPVAKTEANFATLLGWDGIGIGSDPTGGDAVITGTGSGAPIVTLTNAIPAPGQAGYGAENRFGEMELVSVRTISSNVLSALWSISAVG